LILSQNGGAVASYLVVGWVGDINDKDHLSPAEAENWGELGKTSKGSDIKVN